MSEVNKFTVYDDGGHCYCAVNLDFLRELRISNLISGYSFIDHNNGVVYLEEDCDMAIFCERMKLDGVKYEFEEEYVEPDEDSDFSRWVYQFSNYEGDDDCEEDQNTTGLESLLGEDGDEEDWDEDWDEDEEEEED